MSIVMSFAEFSCAINAKCHANEWCDNKCLMIISAMIKTQNLKVGLKFYKRSKRIPGRRKMKRQKHECRKVLNMCKERESGLVYLKLRPLYSNN